MIIGIAGQFGFARVYDDQFFTFENLLLDLGTDDRVGLCRVGADYHDELGERQV